MRIVIVVIRALLDLLKVLTCHFNSILISKKLTLMNDRNFILHLPKKYGIQKGYFNDFIYHNLYNEGY